MVSVNDNSAEQRRPSVAVFKFASCDGCQLSLLDCEDELLMLPTLVDIAHFPEASSASVAGPYDVSLVEGSITTPEDEQRIQEVRAMSGILVTIGACATAGGIQSLKNWADHEDYLRCVYAHPEYISTLSTSTAIAEHVKVDYELRGCPVDRHQLLQVVRTLARGETPRLPNHSVCLDCKRRGTVCIEVAQGVPCIGPVTQAGCGAICPAWQRGCFGCFGPAAQANCEGLTAGFQELGHTPQSLLPLLRGFTAGAAAFRDASDKLAEKETAP